MKTFLCVLYQVKRTRGTSYPWLKENIKGSCRLQSGKWHEAVFVSDNPSLLLNFYQRPTFPRSCLVTLSTWQRLWSSFLCIIFECMNNKARVLLRSHFWEPSRSRNTSTNILWAKVFEFSSRSTLNFSFRVNWITFGRKDASLKTCESKSEWKLNGLNLLERKKLMKHLRRLGEREGDILQGRSGRIRINHLFMCSCLLPWEMKIQRRR